MCPFFAVLVVLSKSNYFKKHITVIIFWEQIKKGCLALEYSADKSQIFNFPCLINLALLSMSVIKLT